MNKNAFKQSCTTFCQLYILDAVSDYHGTPPVKPDNTAPELWRLRALTIFSEFFLSQLLEPLQQPASAAASRRVLELDILEVSSVWLHVLRTCVCISVFDFRAYVVQLKTELHFRGRVNDNAFRQSCTTTVYRKGKQ